VETKQPIPPRVNQKRIALAAGVSQATVSLVLAGQPVTSEETRNRVLETAHRLKYRPNLLVRGMQTGKTRTIGVMAPPLDYYWSEILYGIHDALAAADHVPITLWSSHDRSGPWRRKAPEANVLEQVHRLLDRRIDGVILWPPFAIAYEQHVEEFSSRDLPVVTIDHELPPRFRADSVLSDETQGGALVAEHLLSLGHRHIGQLAGPANALWAIARRNAFESAVQRLDGKAKISTMVAPPGQTQLATEAVRQLLDGPDRPTAIYAASDLYAKVIYVVARELGLSIPKDVSVVGFSDDDFAEEMEPPLTTIRQPSYEIGRSAAGLVLGRSEGTLREPAPSRVTLPVSLIARGSTVNRLN
jgi:LacI family transcriptional regulator